MISDKTRNIIVLIFTTVVAIVILLASTFFIGGLYTGRVIVPESVKGQFWLAAIGILAIAAPFVRGVIDAAQRRKTHDQVVAVRTELHNGLQEAFAQKTVEAIKQDPDVQLGNGHAGDGGTDYTK